MRNSGHSRDLNKFLFVGNKYIHMIFLSQNTIFLEIGIKLRKLSQKTYYNIKWM